MDDIKTLKNEVERIRHHLDLQKKASDENTKLLVDIKSVLVGNHLNEGGMVKEQREIKTDVQDLQEFKQEVNVYIRQAKYIIGILIGAIVTLGIKLFSK